MIRTARSAVRTHSVISPESQCPGGGGRCTSRRTGATALPVRHRIATRTAATTRERAHAAFGNPIRLGAMARNRHMHEAHVLCQLRKCLRGEVGSTIGNDQLHLRWEHVSQLIHHLFRRHMRAIPKERQIVALAGAVVRHDQHGAPGPSRSASQPALGAARCAVAARSCLPAGGGPASPGAAAPSETIAVPGPFSAA
jgi:hypothetical protein